MVTHAGGCHCGAVAYEVDAPAQLNVVECNCSICGPAAYQHLIVPRERFRLLRGEESLSTYEFGTRTARHLFCRGCGVKSFYVPRSHPEGVSVNARCLTPGTVESLSLQPFDGAHWEEARADLERDGAGGISLATLSGEPTDFCQVGYSDAGGSEIGTYSGECQGDVPDGVVTVTYASGEVLEAEFRQGALSTSGSRHATSTDIDPECGATKNLTSRAYSPMYVDGTLQVLAWQPT